MKQERIESIHARYDFSPGELNEIANEMALVVQQIEDLEEEKKQIAKELSEKIKTVSEHLQYLARCRRNGHDFRTMECVVQYDLVTGMKEFYWTGDNRLVDTREMTPQELKAARQTNLFEWNQMYSRSIKDNEMIRITVYGKPQHKRRHRAVRRGDYAGVYDPEENQEAAATIQTVAMQHRPEQLLDGPLIVEIIAYFPIPKSASKQKRKDMLAGKIRPTVKPDWDNIGKIYSDALNNIIYPDDKQIVTGITHKLYSETPRVVIDIRKFEPETYGEDHAILPQRRGAIELKPEHTGETLRQLSFLESAVNDQ